MNITHAKTLTRSIFPVAVGALVVASCAVFERENDEDRHVTEIGTIPPEPHSAVCNGGRWACKAQVRTDANHAIKPFVTPSGYGPGELASVYKLDPAKTSTATVAIVSAFAYPNAASDLATYRSQFGLPPCTVANGCLSIDNTQGAGNAPAGDDWTIEAALDLDMVSAACPTCKILLVNAKDDIGNGLLTAQHQAANHAGVVAISDSWGSLENGTAPSLDSQFFVIPGINIFVAGGDTGAGAPAYPSTSPHVISVGGTTVFKFPVGPWMERAWADSGSSCSAVFSKPSFQSGVPTGCPERATNDIAAVADPDFGLAVFNAAAGGWIVVGGTSAASPLVAGIFARYRIPPSNNASYLYTHPSEFSDITMGPGAGPGWDAPTGIGTPNGAVLGAGACAHPICLTGTNLLAMCDPCAQQICAVDSFCCNNSWDSICVGEVSSVCRQTCSGSTCPHSVCITGTMLPASCDSCVSQICGVDSFCCNNSWDSICIGEVSSVCHLTCN